MINRYVLNIEKITNPQKRPTYQELYSVVRKTKDLSVDEKSILYYILEKRKGLKKREYVIKTNKQSTNRAEKFSGVEKGTAIFIYDQLYRKGFLERSITKIANYNSNITYILDPFKVMMLRQGKYTGDNGENVISINSYREERRARETA